MCKLNIHCTKPEGKCNCTQGSLRSPDTIKQHQSLLCSIIQYIKNQPEILDMLSKSSNIPLESVISAFPIETNTLDSDKFCDEIDAAGPCNEFFINLLGDIPSRIVLGRAFPLMAEIVDKNFTRLVLPSPALFQVVIIDKVNGEEKRIIGEIAANELALFKKIVVNENYTNCLLVIRVKDRHDIEVYSQEVCFKTRKDKLVKRFKAQESLGQNEMNAMGT
jgi:hypothetical protein